MPLPAAAAQGGYVLLVHVRSFLARHRAVHWALVVALATTVGLTVLSKAAALDRERSSWGESQSVWVATGSIQPGAGITARAIELPVAAISTSAVGENPSGLTALHEIADGEVIVAADIQTADLLPTGWRAVAIAADEQTIPLTVGDHVDVVADQQLVASGGIVLDVAAAMIVVATPAEDAPTVATAAHNRSAVLVRRSP
jgi:hypothetical protein